MVRESVELYRRTDGLFDPSILPALIQVGYGRSMDEIRDRLPLPARDLEAWSRPDLLEILLDEESSAVRLPAGMKLDFGGIAKGWIAERSAGLLKQVSDACAVSAGGDFALSGLPQGQESWEISLEDPRDFDNTLAVLKV